MAFGEALRKGAGNTQLETEMTNQNNPSQGQKGQQQKHQNQPQSGQQSGQQQKQAGQQSGQQGQLDRDQQSGKFNDQNKQR